MTSDDPSSKPKPADILGLYLHPPNTRPCSVSMRRPPFQAWIVSIRPAALARTRRTSRLRVLPAWNALLVCGAEYRHGSRPRQKPLPAIPVVSLSTFCKRSYPCAPRQQIHIILDNLSPHTKLRRSVTSCNSIPESGFHFTPTYSSWLNQVEIWFARSNAEVIARRHLHLGLRLGSQTPTLHQRLLRQCSADPMEIL